MSFLKTVLEPPRYGFTDSSGQFVRPTSKQLFSEFFYRMNVFKDKRNWLIAFDWTITFLFLVPFLLFFTHYFTWKLFTIGFVYSMVLMGTHGTIYLHRFGTHRAFKFKNLFWTQVCKNLVIKVIPEEIYIVSHHVHHKFSEKPGDPYNVHGGWLYCFLADAIHQTISRTLTRDGYARVARMVEHTGVKANSYEQYQRWGTVANPARTLIHYTLNWSLNYALFYWIGGTPLAIAIFGMAGVWAFGIRTYNYDGHGRGVDKRQDGIDFNRTDMSINQVWPGYVAGEWHNNHHLYPSSARSGFLPYQVDGACAVIRMWHRLGIVSSYRDDRDDFYKKFINVSPEVGVPPAISSTEPAEDLDLLAPVYNSGLEIAPISRA